ncbi:hypothetical protein diail_5745 [Diaporthe ilicicola]|nr:hypothetical protein diail_5745 [Diaporthe ilicicola]
MSSITTLDRELGWNVRILVEPMSSCFAGFYQQDDWLSIAEAWRELNLCYEFSEHQWRPALLPRREDAPPPIHLTDDDNSPFPTPNPEDIVCYFYVHHDPGCSRPTAAHTLRSTCIQAASRPKLRQHARYLPIGKAASGPLLKTAPLRGKKRQRTASTSPNRSDNGPVYDDDEFPESLYNTEDARKHMAAFRESVLKVGDGRCAITGKGGGWWGKGVGPAIHAAHIVPQLHWSVYPDSEQRVVQEERSLLQHAWEHTWAQPNGLLLASHLHTCFDARLISIHPDTRKVRSFVPYDMITEYHGRAAQLPTRIDLHALRHHYDMCCLENMTALKPPGASSVLKSTSDTVFNLTSPPLTVGDPSKQDPPRGQGAGPGSRSADTADVSTKRQYDPRQEQLKSQVQHPPSPPPSEPEHGREKSTTLWRVGGLYITDPQEAEAWRLGGWNVLEVDSEEESEEDETEESSDEETDEEEDQPCWRVSRANDNEPKRRCHAGWWQGGPCRLRAANLNIFHSQSPPTHECRLEFIDMPRRSRAASLPPASAAGDADSEFTVYTPYPSTRQKKQPKKRMTCKFCKWDSLFSVFDQSDHLAKCEAFDRAQKLRSKTTDCLASIVAGPSSTSAAEITLELLQQFDLLRTRRFQRMQRIVDTLRGDWMSFWVQYQEWRQTANTKISQLRQSGDAHGAETLAQNLLSDKFDYGNFKLLYDTPFGKEILHLTGVDALHDMRVAVTAGLKDAVSPSACEQGPSEEGGAPRTTTMKSPDRGDSDMASQDGSSNGLHDGGDSDYGSSDRSSDGSGGRCSGRPDNCPQIKLTSNSSGAMSNITVTGTSLEMRRLRSEPRDDIGVLCGDSTAVDEETSSTLSSQEGSLPHEDKSAVADLVSNTASSTLAGQVDIDDAGLEFTRAPITLDQARRAMHWLTRTQSGRTFCLRCNCPDSIAPNPDEESAMTHVLVPSFFHKPPFFNGHALQHFRAAHGVGEKMTEARMLARYGTEATTKPYILGVKNGTLSGLKLCVNAQHRQATAFVM